MEIGNIRMNLNATTISGLSIKEVREIQKKYGKNKILYQNKLKDFLTDNFLYLVINTIIFLYAILMLCKIYQQTQTLQTGYIAVIFLVIFSILIEAIKYNLFCKKIKEMNEYQKVYVSVKRDGVIKSISAEELVVGDIISIKAGNFVPADCKILESNHMVLDEYWIDSKSNQDVQIKKNQSKTQFVFAGSLVKSGTAIAEVTNIGMNMKIGKKAKMLISCQSIKNSILGKYEMYIKKSAVGIVATILALLLLGVRMGGAYHEIFMICMCLFVTMSANTIPSIIKFYFLLSSKKLIEAGVQINHVGALEKLENVNVVCLEKNQLLKSIKVHEMKSPYYEKDKKFMMTLMVMGISNIQENNLQGSRIDKALAIEAEKMGIRLKNINRNLEKKVDFCFHKEEKQYEQKEMEFGSREIELLDYESFNSDDKINICIYKLGSKYRIIAKGASDKILKKCNRFYENKKAKYIRDKDLFKFGNQINNMEEKGDTVIAVAYKDIENIDFTDVRTMAKDLIYAGAVSFQSEFYEDLFEEINRLKEQKIKTVLFTGDSKQTAKLLAKKIGMNIQHENMISGKELDKISDTKLKRKIGNYLIYARVNAYQKSRVIQILKQQKNIVCMVGSKVEDVQVMDKADVGISMDNRSQCIKNPGRYCYQKC